MSFFPLADVLYSQRPRHGSDDHALDTCIRAILPRPMDYFKRFSLLLPY